MRAIREFRIPDWRTLVRRIEATAKLPSASTRPPLWIFRGQEDASRRLCPTIERQYPSNTDKVEAQLFYDFKTKAALWAERVPNAEDLGDWYALMRHYGIPSRLLDWTYSPFVAAYFATERRTAPNPKKKTVECAIWALNLCEIYEAAKDKSRAIGLPLGPSGNDFSATDFLRHALRHTGPNKKLETGLVVPLLTKGHNRRISTQQSLFLLNCSASMNFEDSLFDMMKACRKVWLKKFVIPSSARTAMLQRLVQYNVHALSLFPDLAGLSQFVGMKTEIFPPECWSSKFD